MTPTGLKPPKVFEMTDVAERKKVLAKFTRSNIKVPRQLDPDQLSNLIEFFINKTLSLIQVKFSDLNKLTKIIE